MKKEERNLKIRALQDRLEVHEKCLTRKKILVHEMQVLHHQLTRSKARLGKEKQDLDELEKKNLRSLFSQYLGTDEEKVEKERQEYLQAALNYNAIIDEIGLLEYEEKLIEKNILKNPKEVSNELKKLIRLKEKELKYDVKTRKSILAFDAKINGIDRKIKDIKEALKEGSDLKVKLQSINKKLKNVKKWGATKMHGRGRYSSYNKKTYIDEANREVVLADILIKQYDKEVQDIFPSVEHDITTDNFRDFLSIFYDNLITDWVILKKLDTAIHTMEDNLNRIRRIEMNLIHEEEITWNKRKEVEAEKKAYINQA